MHHLHVQLRELVTGDRGEQMKTEYDGGVTNRMMAKEVAHLASDVAGEYSPPQQLFG